MPDFNPSGLSVIILAGEFAGQEGVCLGAVPDGGGLWAVSPNSSNRIVNLKLVEEFGVLINRGQKSERN